MTSPRATPFDDLDASVVLTAAEVAARVRVEPRSVRRAIARGELAASRTCGIRVLAGDAAAWWRERSVAAASPVERPRSSVAAPAPSRAATDTRRPSGRFARGERLPLPPRSGGS